MNRLLFGDNLKPKQSEAESDETPLSSAANAAVSFLPQWLRDTKPSSEGKLRDEAVLFRHPKGDVSGNEHHQLFPDAGVDLVYLDPPFNFYPVYGTNADYNVLFKETSGEADGINRIAYL